MAGRNTGHSIVSDIVSTVLDDCGTTLVSWFDYYVFVPREFLHHFELLRFSIVSSLGVVVCCLAGP